MTPPREPDSRPTIMVVDDERATVSAVKHLFRRRYKILGATRAQDALDLLDENDVAVVLCDQRMPAMTGDQFFGEVIERHPQTVRILITAYSDMQALVRSVNVGRIFAYVAKPWNSDELERIVDSAVAYRALHEENRRMSAELAEANERLRRTNGELRDFGHVVAHNLKEPLRTVSAYAQFLREEVPDLERYGDAPQYLDGILRCSGQMRQQIDDLLRFSELEYVTPVNEIVDLNGTLRRAASLLEGAIAEQNAEVLIPPNLPDVLGDPSRLEQVFQNLLSNGLKFNDKPRPRVDVSAEAAGDGMVAIRVTDNGIGFPPEYSERIFAVFQRLHRRSQYPGTGAGLAIVRKIVDTHGGQVSVETQEGAGSTFTVTLRRA